MSEFHNGFVDDPERQCRGKVQYQTKSDAKRSHAQRQSKYRGRTNPMRPYRCPHCGLWHYGTIPGYKRQLRLSQGDQPCHDE